MANIPTEELNQTSTLLSSAQEILIALGKNPTYDQVAASLSLYLALSSRGKRVSIVSPQAMTVQYSQLVGIDKIAAGLDNVGNGKNLVISFPYQEGSIEKVSYNIENDTFNLVIEPREGYPVITPENINYSFSGGNIDLIFTVGVANFADLDSIYQSNQALFTDKPVVNIDCQNSNQRFAKINIIDTEASSLSELMISLLSSLGMTMDSDIASNLFGGISAATGNFTSANTSAMTFEAAAICLKNGAQKRNTATTQQNSNAFPPFSPQSLSQQSQQQYTKPYSMPSNGINNMQKSATFQSQKQQQFGGKNQLQKEKQQFVPAAQPQFQPKPPQQFQQKPATQPQQQQKPSAPPDWLKPKIYKGSTLL